MRARSLTFVLCATVLGCGLNCTKRDAMSQGRRIPNHYQLYRSSDDWDVEVWINNQPVVIAFDATSAWYDVTPYVISGTNSIRVRARYTQGLSGLPPTSPGELELSLNRISYPGRERETLSKVAAVSSATESVDEEASFQADMPITWTWQQADDLALLTSAEELQVMSAMHEVAAAYKKRDPRAAYDLCERWWQGSQRPDTAYWHSDLAESLDTEKLYSSRVKNWTVTVAERSDIRFTAGTKLLCLTVPRLTADDSMLGSAVPKPVPVIRAGPPPRTPLDGTHDIYGYCLAPVFLVKVKGAWRVLYWDWFL